MTQSVATPAGAEPTGQTTGAPQAGRLRRGLGVPGAILLGLGSIVGTGAFVAMGLGAGIVGPGVVQAILLAGLLATFNGLSSAQLAASYPVSGGTYAYGYRYLNPAMGFTAGWLFLWAKSASAATAALGLAGYALPMILGERALPGSFPALHLGLTLGSVALLTGLILSGVRRTNLVNAVIVSLTLLSLVGFVLACLPATLWAPEQRFEPIHADDASIGLLGHIGLLLQAAALMFVAYTGYGRIATMGEEVREPRKSIPTAMIATLVISAGLYVAVSYTAVGAVGAEVFSKLAERDAAPLRGIVTQVYSQSPTLAGALGLLLGVGAITAMLGVLLNLLLGLSRVLLAMGRRGDVPTVLGSVDAKGRSATPATLAMAAIVAGLALIGDVKLVWSFSAFMVLCYYALTNLSALQIPKANRLYPRWVSWCGLIGCLGLAFWVPREVWVVGLTLIAVGLIWHYVATMFRPGHDEVVRVG